ncbi:MAG: DUF2232 domain-containing protein [Candidatus Eisenbacteria sp.]|nr:DUF2232 domain-containing protein [Candidatus Eisenbacteria bacterium]
MRTVGVSGDRGRVSLLEPGRLPDLDRDPRRGPMLAGVVCCAAATAGLGMGIVGMVLAPLAFAWLRLRHGRAAGFWGLAAGVVAGGLLKTGEGLVAVVILGLTGLLMAWGREKQWGAHRVIAVASLPLVVVSALQSLVLVSTDARGIFLSELQAAVDEAGRLQSVLGVSPEGLAAARELAVEVGDLMWLITPALGVVLAVVLSFVVYRIGQWLFPRFGVRLASVAPFRGWTLGERFVWVPVLGLVLEISRIGPAVAVGHNILVAAGVAYMVQGAAILAHVLEKRRVPKVGRILVWIVGLVFLQPASGVVAVAMGLLDTWVDFRRRPGPEQA